MPFKPLDAGLHVAPQITRQDIARAADAGIKAIINVRPDGEQATAMPSADVRSLAEARGVAYHHLPVSPTAITDEHVQGFRDLLECAEGPVLAHCGSGLRAAALWALSHVKEQGVEAVMARAAEAGIDLSKVAPRLEQAAS